MTNGDERRGTKNTTIIRTAAETREARALQAEARNDPQRDPRNRNLTLKEARAEVAARKREEEENRALFKSLKDAKASWEADDKGLRGDAKPVDSGSAQGGGISSARAQFVASGGKGKGGTGVPKKYLVVIGGALYDQEFLTTGAPTPV